MKDTMKDRIQDRIDTLAFLVPELCEENQHLAYDYYATYGGYKLVAVDNTTGGIWELTTTRQKGSDFAITLGAMITTAQRLERRTLVKEDKLLSNTVECRSCGQEFRQELSYIDWSGQDNDPNKNGWGRYNTCPKCSK